MYQSVLYIFDYLWVIQGMHCALLFLGKCIIQCVPGIDIIFAVTALRGVAVQCLTMNSCRSSGKIPARFPSVATGDCVGNGSRDTMANAGAHRRVSVGKPTVVSIEIPHMPDVADMLDDLRCILLWLRRYVCTGDCHVVGCDVWMLSTFIRTKIRLLVFTNRRCFRDHIKLLGDDRDSTYHATLWRACSDCTKNQRQFIECGRMFIKGYTGHASVHQPIKTHY